MLSLSSISNFELESIMRATEIVAGLFIFSTKKWVKKYFQKKMGQKSLSSISNFGVNYESRIKMRLFNTKRSWKNKLSCAYFHYYMVYIISTVGAL